MRNTYRKSPEETTIIETEKSRIAKLILFHILEVFMYANFKDEEIPVTLPHSSLLHLADEPRIAKMMLMNDSLSITANDLNKFHDDTLHFARANGYNYPRVYEYIKSRLHDRGVYSEENPHDDDGEHVSILLRDIILFDSGTKKHVAPSTDCHIKAALSVAGHGKFFNTWQDLFHILLGRYMNNYLSIRL